MADALAKLLAGPSEEGGEESGADGSSELDAAKDILTAVKRNDAQALSLALKRHYEACEASKDEEPADDAYSDDDEE